MSHERRLYPSRIITPADEELVVTLYKSGCSANKILEQLNHKVKTTKTIYDILRRWEIPRKSGVTDYSPTKHEYFSSIDTKEKAYLLGFLVADGWVHPPLQVGIRLARCDQWVVDLLKTETCTNSSICLIPSREKQFSQGHYSVAQEQAQLIVSSSRMVRDLGNLGVIQAKTGREVLPIVSPIFQSHVLRGNLDGDGSIYIHSTGTKVCVRFLGSRYLTAQVSLLLHLVLGVSYEFPTAKQSSPLLSYVEWSREDDCRLIIQYLYQDSDGLRLVRKYEKAKSLLS
jgi:hypothetical protein